MDHNDLYNHFDSLRNDELVDILDNKSDDYTEEALLIIHKIIEERGGTEEVKFEVYKKKKENIEKDKEKERKEHLKSVKNYSGRKINRGGTQRGEKMGLDSYLRKRHMIKFIKTHDTGIHQKNNWTQEFEVTEISKGTTLYTIKHFNDSGKQTCTQTIKERGEFKFQVQQLY